MIETERVSTVLSVSGDESISEAMRRDIESKIALITNGYHRDSDQDTIPDTGSVMSSTIDEDAPIAQQQQVGRVYTNIAHISNQPTRATFQFIDGFVDKTDTFLFY